MVPVVAPLECDTMALREWSPLAAEADDMVPVVAPLECDTMALREWSPLAAEADQAFAPALRERAPPLASLEAQLSHAKGDQASLSQGLASLAQAQPSRICLYDDMV
eukprot:CAMPEP_0197708840 /NCGR_PEP_ID=MMETSP1338-20131121/128156_1 /TAXON_ID=43686 ORGANISM="Pelagodinium beii, Strain RCC1491" /NCGR_SAMPLE_ID=MMETSP1338 /ASSEMBLY_ACC=CAM_ASM_000754 /LENGTH=106 /DNA_ID=CAMNT_0043292771 /DNA_START=391 /DNA_END=711 /DNA_ORIENTATION=-